MPGKKTIVWSGKINLGNYESLGFEVSGEVETPDEALDLALFEAGQLIGLANRANPATAEALRSYVARVFGVREEAFQKGPKKEDPAIYESKPAPSTPAAATLNQVSPLPERMPAPTAAAPATPAPAPAAPAAKPAAPAVATCSKCGAGVTESQKKMSQLFASKTLCKKCLDGGAF